MKRKVVARKFDEIVAFSEIENYIDTPVKRYSSGMYVRLAFAVAAHLDSEILLADEVLAVGDAAFQKKCLGKMEDVSRNQGRTVVFVSHNISAVLSLCTKGVVLNKGSLAFSGEIHDAAKKYLDYATASKVIFGEKSRLESVEITQKGQSIEVFAKHKANKGLDIPCLAVSFYDALGAPIFVANSRNYLEENRNAGLDPNAIRLKISKPLLHDGDYLISVHFGDSKSDSEYHMHCMRLKVQGMVQIRTIAHAEAYGYVYPECEYGYR